MPGRQLAQPPDHEVLKLLDFLGGQLGSRSAEDLLDLLAADVLKVELFW